MFIFIPQRLQITNTYYETLDAAKLAEPFAKSDTVRSGNSGSGLGLTIVRQIMELHGFRLLLQMRDNVFSVEIRFR
jgi:nitrogen fixation/metabolism regulation signal transduction histidine kinase